MTLTSQSRLCRICRTLLPELPAAPACTNCGAVHLAHHSTWPSVLKWFLLRELALTRFHAWHTEQEVWEDLLRDTRNGIRLGSAHPNVFAHSSDVPAVEVYAEVLKAAEEWRANGSPIPAAPVPPVTPNVQRTA